MSGKDSLTVDAVDQYSRLQLRSTNWQEPPRRQLVCSRLSDCFMPKCNVISATFFVFKQVLQLCCFAKAELGLAQLFAGSGLKECRQALAKWHRMCHDLGLPVSSMAKFLGTLTTWEPCKMHKGHYINIWDARCTLAKHNFIELSLPIYVNTKVVRRSISTGKYRRYGMRSSLVARFAILPRAWLLGSAAGGVYSVGPRHAVEQLLGSNGCLPTRSSYSWRFSGRGRGHLWNTTLQRLLRVAL